MKNTLVLVAALLCLGGAPVEPSSLYDNGPVVNSPDSGVGGADESVVQTSLGLLYHGVSCDLGSTTASRVADEIVIDIGVWQVDRLIVYGYENAATSNESTVSFASLRIWDGPPDDPGSTVVFGSLNTDRLLSSSWMGAYRVWESESGTSTQRPIMRVEIEVGTTLSAGTYWLDWSVNGDPFGMGFQTPFVTIDGVTETGNAKISLNGEWQPVDDHGHPQGLPFEVRTNTIFTDGFESGTLDGWSQP